MDVLYGFTAVGVIFMAPFAGLYLIYRGLRWGWDKIQGMEDFK